MRILLVTSPIVDLRQPFAGGTEAFVVQLANALVSRGHKVDVLCKESDEANLFTSLHIGESALRMCDAITSEVSGQKLYQAAQYGLLDTQSYDVIHYHSYYHAIYDFGFFHQNPAVITLHSPVSPRLSLLHKLHRQRSKDVYVAVSRRLAKSWEHEIGGNINVIPNGVLPGKASDDSPKGDYLLWSGRICEEKAPLLAIELAQKHNVPLRIVGPVADETYYTEQIRPRLNDGISYSGHLTQDEHRVLLKQARALLMTSRWVEPFGLVTLEALNEGTPVIGTASGIVEELRQHPVTQIVDPASPRSFEECFNNLQYVSQDACKAFAKQFDFTKTVERYESIYEAII